MYNHHLWWAGTYVVRHVITKETCLGGWKGVEGGVCLYSNTSTVLPLMMNQFLVSNADDY